MTCCPACSTVRRPPAPSRISSPAHRWPTVRERLVFANAYLGARPIVAALAGGRRHRDHRARRRCRAVPRARWCTAGLDAAARRRRDLDRLAQGLTVGHLLECSGQGSGGNFGSQGAWQGIPDLAHIGYPIAEVWEDGTALITKAPGTGGRVNFDTVRQQLLYEVHNPHAYFSPDVVLDMGGIRLQDEGEDRVRLTRRARRRAHRHAQGGGGLPRRLQGRGHLGLFLAGRLGQGAGRAGHHPHAGSRTSACRTTSCMWSTPA